jgi:beta-glucosidase/6-phospho-beta-glucosidase/beta-galactosidase
MAASRHYKEWRTDFDMVEEQGIRFLRYGPPDPHDLAGARQIRLELCGRDLRRPERRDIVPIVDLCHFGVPDWMGNFQNSDLPRLFERYARPSPSVSRGCSSTRP